MYIFYLHIHVKIQCWFPLDQRVRMDSQVQFVLRTEVLTGLAFPPRRCTNTLVYMKWFRKHFFPFFPSCTAEKSVLTCFFIHIIVEYCQTLVKKPKCLRLDSLVLSKEGLPVCPRAVARHSWALTQKGCSASLGPPTPAQGADVHASRAKQG